MLFVITAQDFANPLGELVSTEQPLGLNYLAFAVNPLGRPLLGSLPLPVRFFQQQ